MSGSYLYLAALLRLSLTSTSTATTTEEINSSCTPATPFTKYHGGNNKFFPFPFNYLIVFGQSHSDTGNTSYASNITAFQPDGRSWNGRYADGPVWVVYFVRYFGLPALVSNAEASEGQYDQVTNFAYGGDTMNNLHIEAESTYFDDGNVPAVDDQVWLYPADCSLIVDKNALHVLLSGYNDYWYCVYRNYTTAAGREEDFGLVAETMVRSIVNNMEELYQSGARNFMIMGMHDKTKLPEAINHLKEMKDAYTTLIQQHIHYLSEYITTFQNKINDTTVYLLSAQKSIECIETTRNSLGFYDTQNSFYGGVEVIYLVQHDQPSKEQFSRRKPSPLQ